ncbi:MAG: exo-alpha-sialidase [Thermoplasmata archaeon]|nr:MAG: exo-alpha-sialidase [Thermoplasmata archaeon]
MTSVVNAQPQGWSEDIRLTLNAARSQTPAIAVEGNEIHVVYADNEGGKYLDMFLWYINSSDSGNTWNLPICLVNSPSISILSPKIAVNGSNIHVIWLEYNSKTIYYIRSLDNGKVWSTEVALTSDVYPDQINWDIGVYENNLHIVFVNENYKLSYIQSNDNGVTWSIPKVLVPSIDRVIESAIEVSGNNIHIAFRATRERMGKRVGDILYIRSIESGINWDGEVEISFIPGVNTSCSFPDIAVAKNDIFIVYRDYGPGRRQIYYSHSADNGVTWEKGIKLSNSTQAVVVPAIAAENNNVCAVWEDDRAPGGSWELFFKSSYDRGNTWGDDTRLTIAPETSDSPDIVINENTVHIVWSDRRDGNREIYYKSMLLPSSLISAIVDIKPDTLNLKSKGRWITAYIELPYNYTVFDIDISTILLENTIPVENHPTEIGDYDSDGIIELMVKFDRADVEDHIGIPMNSKTLTITGEMVTNESFKGNDIVRIILHS